MHRAHLLGAALVCCILEQSGVSKVAIGAAAVALLAIGLLLVTAEPWKVLWGLALSGAHLAHFPGWDPQDQQLLVELGLVYGAVAMASGRGHFRLAGC